MREHLLAALQLALFSLPSRSVALFVSGPSLTLLSPPSRRIAMFASRPTTLATIEASVADAEAAVAAAFTALSDAKAEPEKGDLVAALKTSKDTLDGLRCTRELLMCKLRLVQCSSGEAAAAILDELAASGIAPDAVCFRAALSATAAAAADDERGEWAALLYEEAAAAGMADAQAAAIALRAMARSSQWELASRCLAQALDDACIPPALDLEGALVCAAASAAGVHAGAEQLANALSQLLSSPSELRRFARVCWQASDGDRGDEASSLLLALPGGPFLPPVALARFVRTLIESELLPRQLEAGPTRSVVAAPLDVWLLSPEVLSQPSADEESRAPRDEGGKGSEPEEQDEGSYWPSWDLWREAWAESAATAAVTAATAATARRRRGGSDVYDSYVHAATAATVATVTAWEGMAEGVARELGAMSGGLDAEGQRAVVGATRLLAAAEMTAAHARLLTVFRCPGEADDEAAAAAGSALAALQLRSSKGLPASPERCHVVRIEPAGVEACLRHACLEEWYRDAASEDARRQAEQVRRAAEEAAREAAVAVAEASVADLRSRRQDKWKKVNEKFMREREAERLAKRGTMAVALDAMVERMAADRGLALRGNGRGVARPTEMPDRERERERGKSGAKKRARVAGNARVPMAEEVTGSEATDTAPLPPPTEPAAPTERVGSRAARVLANAEDDVSVLKGIGRARAEKLRAAGAGSVGALARLSEEAARDLVVTHRMPLKSLLVSMEEARRIISGIVISERSLSSESQF